MLKLDITRQTKNFLNKLDSEIFRQIAKKIFALTEKETPKNDMKNNYPLRRAHVGDYRIIYRVEKEFLKVTDVRNMTENNLFLEYANYKESGIRGIYEIGQ